MNAHSDGWRDRWRILCPGWEPETCDCGSTELLGIGRDDD